MRTTRSTCLWALALCLLAFPITAHPGYHDEAAAGEPADGSSKPHAEMHAEHHPEGETCPMVVDAQKAMMADVRADLERASKKLLDLAKAIPADEYDWAPSEDVRSVSEVFVHVASGNTFLPAAIGAPPAEGVDMSKSPYETMQKWEQEITEKDAVIAKLESSFEYVQGALQNLETMDMDETLELFGPMSRRSYVYVVLTHTHEHLGQAIAYARSLGVTPPWSEAAEEGGE